MAPNSPARSFIHALMAGSRSTAPLNRSNSVLIVARLPAFEIHGYIVPLDERHRLVVPGGTKTIVLSDAVALTECVLFARNLEVDTDYGSRHVRPGHPV